MDVRQELLARMPKSLEAHRRSAEVVASEIVSTVDMPNPFYVERAKGCRLTDVDGNEYVDLTMGFGPHFLGYSPDFVTKAVQEIAPRAMQFGIHTPYQEPLARLIADSSPAVEQLIFCNSGTEASLYAMRAARALTGKDKVAMFDGGYHGAHDGVLNSLRRGSPLDAPTSFARGSGIPDATAGLTPMLPYRSEIAFDLIRKQKNELAMVMLEPVQSSNPRTDHKDWMHELQAVCRESGVLFMLDEVISGFRLAFGGGQELFDLQPDLAIYGKIIGGGTPIGAVGGSA